MSKPGKKKVREECPEIKACNLMKKDKSLAKLEWAYPNNWTQKYNVYCDKAGERDAAKTTVLIENTIICLVLLALADTLGRKTILITAGLMILVGMHILVFSPWLGWKMVGMGMAAGAEGSFSALFSIMINETTRKFNF